jgi:hypothetical protein
MRRKVDCKKPLKYALHLVSAVISQNFAEKGLQKVVGRKWERKTNATVIGHAREL